MIQKSRGCILENENLGWNTVAQLDCIVHSD